MRRAVAKPLPHPDEAELRAAAIDIQNWAFADYKTLSDQPIGLTATPEELTPYLDLPPPETGEPFSAIFQDFRRHVLRNAFRVNHPRFLAFVPGPPCFPSILGDWLADAANLFAGVWLEASGPAQVESTVLDWFRQWLGMPETTRGILTSGGSKRTRRRWSCTRASAVRGSWADRGSTSRINATGQWTGRRRSWGLHLTRFRSVPVDKELSTPKRDSSTVVHDDRRRAFTVGRRRQREPRVRAQ